MYKEAAKMKLRFASNKGDLCVEDLFDLPLTSARGVSLDGLARAAYKALGEFEVSFVQDVSLPKKIAALRLDILKDVITDKLAEREAAKSAALAKAKKEKIMEIIAEKEFDDLRSQDVSKLKQMLAEL